MSRLDERAAGVVYLSIINTDTSNIKSHLGLLPRKQRDEGVLLLLARALLLLVVAALARGGEKVDVERGVRGRGVGGVCVWFMCVDVCGGCGCGIWKLTGKAVR